MSLANNDSNDSFLEALQEEAQKLTEAVTDEKGEWIIKGFIDLYKNVYTISVDTKVVSKVLELLLFPKFLEFGDKFGYNIVLTKEQNFYPDISFVSKDGREMYALDIKSTYRTNRTTVNGMTLGAFTGYFRDRQSTKNTTFPYARYKSHIVLGVIYSQSDGVIDERKKYKLDDLAKINSVIKDFIFFAQPKYKIASSRPGSGNTKNIGSVTKIAQLLNGEGPFSKLGEEIYDDYWMYYLTKDMAKKDDILRPYKDLKTYMEYKERKPIITQDRLIEIEKLDTGPEDVDEEEYEQEEQE